MLATPGALAPRCQPRPRSPRQSRAGDPQRAVLAAARMASAQPKPPRETSASPEPHVGRSLPRHSGRVPVIGVGPSHGGVWVGIAPSAPAAGHQHPGPPTPCHLRPSASQPRAAARALPPVRGAQTPWGWARLPTYRTRWGRSPQPLPGRAVKEEMEISGSHQLSTFAALTSPVTPGSSHACSHTHTRARAHPRPLRAPGQTHNTRRRKEQKERGGGGGNIQ